MTISRNHFQSRIRQIRLLTAKCMVVVLLLDGAYEGLWWFVSYFVGMNEKLKATQKQIEKICYVKTIQ